MNNTEPLPCPFCGNDAILREDRFEGYQWEYWTGAYVICIGCGARGKVVRTTYYYSDPTGTREDAIAAWNRRV